MAKNVLVLKHFEQPKDAGVYYRLVCLTGVSKGESYVLMGNRVVVGRGDRVDLRINDQRASREHAELTRVGDKWIVTDLGSQNGIVINEKKVTQKQLSEGDKLIVGQTVFKFAKVEVSAKKSQVKEDESEESSQKKGLIPFIILLVMFAGLFLLDDGPSPSKKNKTSANEAYQDVTNEYVTALKKRQANEDKQLKEKLNVIYARGLREFREGNFYRAIHEFNLALIVAPGDSQAEFYLRKTKEELDKSIEDNIVMAQREEAALRYQSAIKNYCAIIRLLYSVPDDPRHKNAVTQIKDLELKLGLDQGETDCLKKQRTNQ